MLCRSPVWECCDVWGLAIERRLRWAHRRGTDCWMCYRSRQEWWERRRVKYRRFSIYFVSSPTNTNSSRTISIERSTVHCIRARIVRRPFRSISMSHRNWLLYLAKRNRQRSPPHQRLRLWIKPIIPIARSISRWKWCRQRSAKDRIVFSMWRMHANLGLFVCMVSNFSSVGLTSHFG